MSKKSVKNASIEELLADICRWEDMDSALIVSSTEDGGAFVMTYDGEGGVVGPTLRVALIRFMMRSLKKHPWMLDDDEVELYRLDWRSYYDANAILIEND